MNRGAEDSSGLEQALHAADEHEREPVPEKALKGPAKFWGMYAGEHTAGTEFMIGPMFLAGGVGVFDLFAGLLLGNLLAVLSWRFVCAPVATRTRLTLYAQLERIAGRRVVALYNLANGILFCFLAGAMITVSATAVVPALQGVGIPLEVRQPTLQDLMPTGVSWVVIVLLLGAVIAVVAARGYDSVARVANLAAPWMILIFIACAVVTLPKLDARSAAEIWKGSEPLAGSVKLTFWHVLIFAWCCNAAMHLGMSDMSVLRYARKASYGWASAAGMYLGHFLAWISASILFALEVQRNPESPANAPGPMVENAVGFAGLVCVIVAGWTTANPTIYRAGLAFQGIFPRSSRAWMTLLAGGVATVAGVFPAVAMRLLDFVGIYGTILAPAGAIVFLNHWAGERWGLMRDYAATTGAALNPAVLAAWLIPVGFCLVDFVWTHWVWPPFLAVPAWLAAGLLYLTASKRLPRRSML
ncbi:MAG TPA: hypothetical protein VMN36_16510 [Verrucomicrobiales bacterium]|nr:hypothetical protein [Verrucomicrobiales bacterium]